MTAVTNLEAQNALTQTSVKQHYREFQVEFPRPFGDLPEGLTDKLIVIGTVELVENDSDDLYVVNVTNITRKGFVARVGKIFGSSEKWSKLQFNYTATRVTLYGGQ
jgi:hypothetical protein